MITEAMIPPHIKGKTIGLALGSPQRMGIGHLTLMEIILYMQNSLSELASGSWTVLWSYMGGIVEGHQSEASN